VNDTGADRRVARHRRATAPRRLRRDVVVRDDGTSRTAVIGTGVGGRAGARMFSDEPVAPPTQREPQMIPAVAAIAAATRTSRRWPEGM
jgi:hypothetical protein